MVLVGGQAWIAHGWMEDDGDRPTGETWISCKPGV